MGWWVMKAECQISNIKIQSWDQQPIEPTTSVVPTAKGQQLTARSSPRPQKTLIAHIETVAIGVVLLSSWEVEALLVQRLETVFEHGSVLLFQHVAVHLNDIIRADPDDLLVICGVVDLAQGKAVLDDGLAVRLPVRDYMCGV